MPNYSAGVRTGAGSTTLPIISLYAAAAVGAKLLEVGVFNTTDTPVEIRLVRLTTTGTQGAGLTEAKHDPTSAAAACTAFTTHTVGPTLGDDLGYRAVLGARGGVIFTFEGIAIPVGTGNGIGIIVENGTGQVTQSYVKWSE